MAVGMFVIAAIIFLGVLIIFIRPEERLRLESQSDSISEITSNPQNNISFVKENQIDPESLKEFSSLSYEELKQKLGLKDDFCIYLEDQAGNLVPFIIDDNTSKVGIGKPAAYLNGIPCGENVSVG